MQDIEIQNVKNKIIGLLSEYLGVEPQDIKMEDSLSGELHMQPTELSDFLTTLEENGFEVNKLDLTEIDSVEDLCESLI